MVRLSLLLLAVLTAAAQNYEPTWESLRHHKVPEWFEDAKLGIFIHWGLYSVPAWATPSGELGKVAPDQWFKNNPYAEWYLNTLKIPDSPTRKHHTATYGESFQYLDFVPIFNREIQKWNPYAWAKLFQEAGARYVVLTTKHHDGFTLWPSQVRNPHRRPDQQHASRDLVGELTKAVRAQNLKMGLYYSGGLDWSFVETPIAVFGDLRKTVPQTEEYARYADAHWRELMDRYQPAILWNDISYPKQGDVLGIFSAFYNRTPDGLINNRFGVDHADITTPEYSSYNKITEKKWEACRGLGFSFGYNQAEGPQHVIASDKLINLLGDIVSKNGNLLLNVGPKPDGTISDLQLQRLRDLGAWLKMNGEAIYGTRPWVRPDARTADGIDVRFTQKGNAVYALLLDRPKSREISIDSLVADSGSTVELLGAPGALPWSQSARSLKLTLPEKLPGSHALALKISPKPWKLVRE